MLTANVRGPFATIRAFAPLLKESGDGVIINISSGAAEHGTGSSIIYGASKAALNTMSMALARVLGPEIRVVVVAPGMVHTGFVPGRTEEMMAKAAMATPLKRAIEPEDVALAVISCVTHLTHTTGSIISVDAGGICERGIWACLRTEELGAKPGAATRTSSSRAPLVSPALQAERLNASDHALHPAAARDHRPAGARRRAGAGGCRSAAPPATDRAVLLPPLKAALARGRDEIRRRFEAGGTGDAGRRRAKFPDRSADPGALRLRDRDRLPARQPDRGREDGDRRGRRLRPRRAGAVFRYRSAVPAALQAHAAYRAGHRVPALPAVGSRSQGRAGDALGGRMPALRQGRSDDPHRAAWRRAMSGASRRSTAS